MLPSLATMEPFIIQRAQRWLDGDPDPSDRAELKQILEAADEQELAARFSGRLRFGTAGLRGPIRAGPMGMNTAVVRQSTAGLGEVLLDRVDDAATRGVVIGFDGRHRSEDFAKEATAVLRAMGIAVYRWDRCLPTPVTAWALQDLKAAAAIQITASHNPPEDNGYKVYWDHGAQIIPPIDAEIATAIEAKAEGPARAISCAPAEAAGAELGGLVTLGQQHLDRYLVAALAACPWRPPTPSPLKIVYTALHGVGEESVLSVLASAGFDELYSVSAQAKPDGHFPTVAFPNPEEDGALDLAVAEARRRDADLIIANDPDADRLALVLPGPGGDWRTLSGNELGSLLGDFCLRHHVGDKPMVVASIVSSELLGLQAQEAGAEFRQALTGFKWIAAAAREEPEYPFIFGFEEALGYTIGELVADKDGVAAALAACCMAEEQRLSGGDLLSRLQDIQAVHGRHLSAQNVDRFEFGTSRDVLDAVVERVRVAPPGNLAELDLSSVEDYARGERWRGQERDLLPGPRANLICLRYRRGDEALRVLVRPSGTEPKVKTYFEWRGQAPEAVGRGRLEALMEAWKQAVE